MSEQGDKTDKTFDPTPQRIRKAREDGNVFKSQETNSVVLLMVGTGMLALGIPYAFAALKILASRLFLGVATTPVTLAIVPSVLIDAGIEASLIIAPFLSGLVVTAVAVNTLQSGWNFTLKALEPKTDRISPVKGFQRIFSSQGVFTAGKSFLKIVIVGPVAYLFISGRMNEATMLHSLAMPEILSIAGWWMIQLVFQLLLVLVLMSAADFAYEKWRYKDNLKMSKQEIKDESKESEGNPEIKAKRRKMAFDISRRPRLDHAILQADVVITNPTHFAVMLRYDPLESLAPVVLAKGIRKRAQRIKALAAEHGVPMVEDRPLARALYHTVNEATEIPADLYPAVAAILAEIYRKKGRTL